MEMRVASMFSGIGGIDLAFQQAGFDVVWANEFDKDAAKTYRHNFGGEHLSSFSSLLHVHIILELLQSFKES